MGQAKNRGTREDRVVKALGLQRRKIEDVRRELGCPDDAQYMGYVVHIPDADEFLISLEEDSEIIRRVFGAKPEHALKFERFDVAYKVARKEKGEVVAVLFENSEQCFVASVE